MSIQSFLDNLIFLNLLIVTVISWASLIFSSLKNLTKIGFYGTACANVLAFLLLGLRWLNFGYFPLSNLYESLIFLVWGITFVTLIVEDNSNVAIVGSISTPIALFVTGFASLSLPESMQAPSPLVPALKSNWLMLHVTVMMLSYASLIVGSLLSIFFLVLAKNQTSNLAVQGNSYGDMFAKPAYTDTFFYESDSSVLAPNATGEYQTGYPEKEKTSENRLGLLESIDNLSYRTISFGFPLLTMGIIAGAVWANEAWGSYWSWDPKETWALITWLVFASYLHARITKSWQGEKPAMIASVGFVVITGAETSAAFSNRLPTFFAIFFLR